MLSNGPASGAGFPPSSLSSTQSDATKYKKLYFEKNLLKYIICMYNGRGIYFHLIRNCAARRMYCKFLKRICNCFAETLFYQVGILQFYNLSGTLYLPLQNILFRGFNNINGESSMSAPAIITFCHDITIKLS